MPNQPTLTAAEIDLLYESLKYCLENVFTRGTDKAAEIHEVGEPLLDKLLPFIDQE